MSRPKSELKKNHQLHRQRVIDNIRAAVSCVEQSWDHRLHRSHELRKLIELLQECANHSDFSIRNLANVRHTLSEPSLDYHSFISSFVEIERSYSRSPSDSEIIISKEDRAQKIPQTNPLYIICDNIRSALNVGAIFRSSDCLGAEKIYLCGYTATPENSKVHKTTMGTHEHVAWESIDKVTQIIEKLRSQDVFVVGLETVKDSKSLYQVDLNRPVALVVGNERYGLDPQTLSLCNSVVHIPMYGVKNSLNVASAMSIAAAEAARQRNFSHSTELTQQESN